jgi:hypothetical protein
MTNVSLRLAAREARSDGHMIVNPRISDGGLCSVAALLTAGNTALCTIANK